MSVNIIVILHTYLSKYFLRHYARRFSQAYLRMMLHDMNRQLRIGQVE